MHHVAIQRAASAAAAIEQALAEAQRAGLLAAFNGEYRRRREAAAVAGKGFMRYERARSRLRKVIATSRGDPAGV